MFKHFASALISFASLSMAKKLECDKNAAEGTTCAEIRRETESGDEIMLFPEESLVLTLSDKEIKQAEVFLAIKYTEDPDSFPGAGGGNTAPAGTFVSKQKIGNLEVEYSQFKYDFEREVDFLLLIGDPWIRNCDTGQIR